MKEQSMKLPKAFSSRCADMGRTAKTGPADLPYKFRLARVPIDAGGYDQGGAYWGLGAPLYWACDEATHSAPVAVPESRRPGRSEGGYPPAIPGGAVLSVRRA